MTVDLLKLIGIEVEDLTLFWLNPLLEDVDLVQQSNQRRG